MAIETKHHAPIVYKVYTVLKQHIGAENAISATELAAQFSISERQLRTTIHEIRNSTGLEKFIGSNNFGYYVCREEEAETAMLRWENQALSMLKVCCANRKKAAKDGQYKIPLGKYYSAMFEAFGEEKGATAQ